MKNGGILTIAISTIVVLTMLSFVPFLEGMRQANQLATLIGWTGPPPKSPLERIRAGETDCRHCNLRGADLPRECVKSGDFTGADLSHTKARYTCMTYTNFTDASFRYADLSGANLGHANLSRADFTGATLKNANIEGANLSTAYGLTQSQIELACADSKTKLPRGLQAVSCS